MSGNIYENVFGTQISSGITTGGFETSEIPCAYMNSIRGGFMIFENVYQMLNLYRNYRVGGMLVKCLGIGPRNEPAGSYYELKDREWTYIGGGPPPPLPENPENDDDWEFSSPGETVGPSTYIDFLLDETLTIYDKDVLGLTYSQPANSDDGTYWVKKEFCSCSGGGGGGEVSNPILPYYSGATVGAALKLTPAEIQTLTSNNDNTILSEYNVVNNYGDIAIPYIALPLSYTNNKLIKTWTISGIPSPPTNRWLVKVNGVWYGLYRISGSINDLQVVNINTFILEDDPVLFLDNKIPFEFPTPTAGLYGVVFNANDCIWEWNEFVE